MSRNLQILSSWMQQRHGMVVGNSSSSKAIQIYSDNH